MFKYLITLIITLLALSTTLESNSQVSVQVSVQFPQTIALSANEKGLSTFISAGYGDTVFIIDFSEKERTYTIYQK